MMAMMMAMGDGEKAPMKKMPSSVEYTKEETLLLWQSWKSSAQLKMSENIKRH